MYCNCKRKRKQYCKIGLTTRTEEIIAEAMNIVYDHNTKLISNLLWV